MKELVRGGARIVRMRYAVMAFSQNAFYRYVNIESLEGREKQKRAEAFLQCKIFLRCSLCGAMRSFSCLCDWCHCFLYTYLQDQYLYDFVNSSHLRLWVFSAEIPENEAGRKRRITIPNCPASLSISINFPRTPRRQRILSCLVFGLSDKDCSRFCLSNWTH